jgi:hypothetical protein
MRFTADSPLAVRTASGITSIGQAVKRSLDRAASSDVTSVLSVK